MKITDTELDELLREVVKNEILKDARPTLESLKALHADRPLLVLALDQAIRAIADLADARSEIERLTKWQERCEELEVVAAALYLGHDDGKEQFDMYRSAYIGTTDDDNMFLAATARGSQWVADRRPDEDGHFIVSLAIPESGIPWRPTVLWFDDEVGWCEANRTEYIPVSREDYPVIAWMPLPEPYTAASGQEGE
jgi:hypothetical protein